MLPNEDNDEAQPMPEVEKGDGGNGLPPRRPTAVGAGGPDDEFEDAIRELRRLDLDEGDEAITEAFQSRPIPGLTFVRVDGIFRSWEIEEEEKNRNQRNTKQSGPTVLPKRTYLMEDALTGLNSQKAYISYIVLGNTKYVNFYMGLSLQSTPQELEENEMAEICFDIQKAILNCVQSNGIDFHNKIYSSKDLKTKIEPLAKYVGITTGFASLKHLSQSTLDSGQIERIVSGMKGLEFGLMVIAAPVPSKLVEDEEYIVLDQIRKAQENGDTRMKRRIKYYLELQEIYLKHIQLGKAIGHWQVGVYFFAPKAEVFARLVSLIKATLTDEELRPTPLRIHVFEGLKEHLLDFGLLRNSRKDRTKSILFQYKFLTPLNSRMLSAYINLPKTDMPGFRVHRT